MHNATPSRQTPSCLVNDSWAKRSIASCPSCPSWPSCPSCRSCAGPRHPRHQRHPRHPRQARHPRHARHPRRSRREQVLFFPAKPRRARRDHNLQPLVAETLRCSSFLNKKGLLAPPHKHDGSFWLPWPLFRRAQERSFRLGHKCLTFNFPEGPSS